MRVNLPHKVELPDSRMVAFKLLDLLKLQLTPVKPSELYETLAGAFNLTTIQLLAKRRTRAEKAWNNRVQTARKLLVERGYMNQFPRGRWSLTDEGRREAQRLEKLTPDDL